MTGCKIDDSNRNCRQTFVKKHFVITVKIVNFAITRIIYNKILPTLIMENDLMKTVKAKAELWLTDSYDEDTRAQVKAMLEAEDSTELVESFYKDLEFGTGGLRGIMGPAATA